MKPALDGFGYLRTVVDGKTIKIHRLVAQTWINNPLNKPQINHINNDRTDNRIENLEWVTHKENIQHMMEQGRQSKNNGEKCGTHVLKEPQVREILKYQMMRPQMSNLSMSVELAKKYPIKSESIRHILKGNTWKSVRSKYYQEISSTTSQ
ncbi:MAG: HNH endonuclease [Candidatus Thorarchaeota archaeon]